MVDLKRPQTYMYCRSEQSSKPHHNQTLRACCTRYATHCSAQPGLPTQSAAAYRSTAQHMISFTAHCAAQHSAAQHRASFHRAARSSTAQHNARQMFHSAALPSITQRSTAQHIHTNPDAAASPVTTASFMAHAAPAAPAAHYDQATIGKNGRPLECGWQPLSNCQPAATAQQSW
jgi:hypothetical protein